MVKVRREADAGSDHILMMATLSLKLRKAKRREKRQLRFGVENLRNRNVEKAFKIEVKNRFSILQDDQVLNVHSFNQVLTEVSKKFLGYNKRRKKDWKESKEGGTGS